MLKNKKIVLGISGGIAAYKCAELVRLFIKQGAEVRVVMSQAAQEFVSVKTLSVVSRQKVLIDFFDSDDQWNNHVHLAEWADVMLIAPLTANTLSKMASGACDNLLMATYLSAWHKSIAAPAMDRDMLKHPGVQQNLRAIESYGTTLIPPDTGELASGLHGEGRMAEPAKIAEAVAEFLRQRMNQPLRGKKALVNAGPTYEPIDPVRFIGNHSSGKMGVAIANALAYSGAQVTLVLGPSPVEADKNLMQVVRVKNSDEMHKAMLSAYSNKDIIVCSAAVADYKPAQVSSGKIKKSENKLSINLVKTKDILEELGKKKKKKQYLVGFALETSNVIEYAKGKLKKKNLDLVVANSPNNPGEGFGADTNRVSLVDKHNKITNFELKPKTEVACDIVDYIIDAIK